MESALVIDSFHTKRLVATRIRESDYADLCRMHSNPVIMEKLGGVRSNEVTSVFLREKMEHWDTYGFGLWIYREPRAGSYIGRGLVEHIEVGGNEEIEVGYTVVQEEWRKGYATEMAQAMLSIGFNVLHIDSIVSFAYPDNIGSRKVMEKSGLTFEHEIEHVGHPQVLYRIHRADFSGQPALEMVDGELVIA